MKLYAISDLHIGSAVNREALTSLSAHPDDWLIVAGDVGETLEHMRFGLEMLTARFARVLWVPGNHELWALDPKPEPLRGEARYQRFVDLCREFDVATPEAPYAVWPGEIGSNIGADKVAIALMFTLYDYSFRPDDVAFDDAIAWAAAEGVVCGDELLLDAAPHGSRARWCARRVEATRNRLQAASKDHALVLVNHYPLRADLLTLPRIPRFSLWCGTRATEDWHRRFNAIAAIHGHLHVRSRQERDGVDFHEVSLGYPRDWDQGLGIDAYLRQILPVPKDKAVPPPLRAGRRRTASGT